MTKVLFIVFVLAFISLGADTAPNKSTAVKVPSVDALSKIVPKAPTNWSKIKDLFL